MSRTADSQCGAALVDIVIPCSTVTPCERPKPGPVTSTRSRSPINTTRADISAPQLLKSRPNQYIVARQDGQSGRRTSRTWTIRRNTANVLGDSRAADKFHQVVIWIY